MLLLTWHNVSQNRVNLLNKTMKYLWYNQTSLIWTIIEAGLNGLDNFDREDKNWMKFR